MKCPNCGFPMKYKYYDNQHHKKIGCRTNN